MKKYTKLKYDTLVWIFFSETSSFNLCIHENLNSGNRIEYCVKWKIHWYLVFLESKTPLFIIRLKWNFVRGLQYFASKSVCFVLMAKLTSLLSTNKERNFNQKLALLHTSAEVCFICLDEISAYLLRNNKYKYVRTHFILKRTNVR